MKRILLAGLLAGMLIPASAPAQKRAATVIGEVVDVVSWMTSGSRPDTPQGREILENSRRLGNPLGILEEGTGRLYIATMKQSATGAGETLLPWIGIRIAAKGDVFEKGGTRVLAIQVVGKSIR
ncbi:MAG: hypothetical protein WB626_03375 [Bacteroidota bacterium]